MFGQLTGSSGKHQVQGFLYGRRRGAVSTELKNFLDESSADADDEDEFGELLVSSREFVDICRSGGRVWVDGGVGCASKFWEPLATGVELSRSPV